MTLNDNYYISDRRSLKYPVPHQEAGTLFIPTDIKEENGMYIFQEYRMSIPVNYVVPQDATDAMAKSIAEFADKVKNATIDGEEKEGYHYEAEYTASGVTYHLVKNAITEVAKGTYENPLYFVPGMNVVDGLYYIDENAKIYACIKDGVAESLGDTAMFLPC